MVIGLFSSCIIVATADFEPQYDITCPNQSNTYISDWCVVRNGSVTYAKKKYDYCGINPNGGTATLHGLPEGE